MPQYTRHGHCLRTGCTPEYRAWRNMITRCTNPRNPSYIWYGARGITVCDRWRFSYTAFYADVGPRPSPGLTLERLDNNRGYEPGNVVWATALANNLNKRGPIFLTYAGTTMCKKHWARWLKIDPAALRHRLRRATLADIIEAIYPTPAKPPFPS